MSELNWLSQPSRQWLVALVLNLTGLLSSHTRQRSPLYEVQCRVHIDTKLRCFMSVWRKLFCPLAAFDLSRLRICWIINLDQTTDMNNNNLESKRLILGFMGCRCTDCAIWPYLIFLGWPWPSRRRNNCSMGVRRIQPHAMNPPYAGPIRNQSFFSELGEHGVEKYFHFFHSSKS